MRLAKVCVVAGAALAASTLAAAAGCEAEFQGTWKTGETGDYAVEAFTRGPTCDRSVAVIVLRDPTGDVAHQEALPAGFVATLAGRAGADEMKSALAEWADPAKSPYKRAHDLPKWPKGADATEGDFPFMTEEGIDRDTYEAIRKADGPVFCYVQGMESMSCLGIVDGVLQPLGVQMFPG